MYIALLSPRISP